MHLPSAAGIGLRHPHVARVIDERPPVAWFEVHSENYFADGGPALAALDRVRAEYPVSLHGVGMALGSVGALDRVHLGKLRRLVDRIDPASVSEHLCWGRFGGRHFNDLLPLPYTEESLHLVAAHVVQMQDAIGRRVLVENLSAYYLFPESDLSEAMFLSELAARTGCGILLDVNNAYVNQRNHGSDARSFIANVDATAVGEIHLAGFDASGAMVVDTHGTPVAGEVWDLYDFALDRFGAVPTLIEWDTDIPGFEVLQAEAAEAARRMEGKRVLAA